MSYPSSTYKFSLSYVALAAFFFSNEQYKPTFKRRRQNIKKVSELNNFFTVNGKLKNFVPMH